MLRIGVTGLMASGKTDVARAFQERGARILSGDALGWDVLHEPDVRERIGATFGRSVFAPDGSVDRRALGKIVFQDAAEMERLNALVQPVLERRVREAIDAPRGEGVLVLDAALLSVWNLEPDLDGVVEVLAPADARIARLAASKGFSEQEARERVQGQKLPPVRGVTRHWRIQNDGDRAQLLKRAGEVWDEIERLRSEAGSG
ncbi:MAG TPA: dephospho-CoA kinase [Candidatus Limnocylindrales bacterium]|nr:dephospho-CoA kinase [Candidatus Limnocylindrales bacterium]